MSAVAVDSLLAPVSDASPCGEDLSSSGEMLTLERELEGKPEQQFGPKIIPAVPPNWLEVRNQTQALLARTRDLRVVVALLRAAARLEGIEGVYAGLRVLRGLVESRWDDVHPRPDGDDPYERANALAALAAHDMGMADLRAARVGSDRGACTLGEVEQAFVVKAEAESAVERKSLRERIRASCKSAPGLPGALTGCAAEVGALEAAFAARKAGQGPDLKTVSRLLAAMAAIGRDLDGTAAASGAADASAGVTTATTSAADATAAGHASGAVRSRADAARVLGTVCEWLEANEPGHPAPLLVRRAQRLLDMSFMQIIRDLVPESADAVERLANVPRE